MKTPTAGLNLVKASAYLALVGGLMAVTMASLVAASGAADVTIKVQYQGPRELPDLSSCVDSPSLCPVKLEILDPEDVFGYGYGYNGGYAYGYRFLEWLSNGYGYSSYSQSIEYDGGTVMFHLTGLPVGHYVFRAYLDLDTDGVVAEDFEPLAFSEESPSDTVFEVTLSSSKSGLTVIGEGEGEVLGHVTLTDGRAATGATVMAYGAFGDVYTTTVQPDGSFALQGLPVGLWYELPYSLVVSKDGYHAAGTEISLGAGTAALETPFELSPMSVDMPLHLLEGWNLISLAVEPDTPAAGDVLGTGTPVFAWNESGYQLLEASDPMVPGLGYWVYADVETSLTIRGIPHMPEPAELSLEGARWHLVGGPAYAATISPDAMGVEMPLYAWASTGYAESTTFWPGVGYWLLTSDSAASAPLLKEGSH